MNQTYNAGMNYGNRNASSQYTAKDMGVGYLGAVFVSVSIALYTRRVFASQLAKLSGANLNVANAFLAFLAGSMAGMMNMMLMRFKELREGIKIQN